VIKLVNILLFCFATLIAALSAKAENQFSIEVGGLYAKSTSEIEVTNNLTQQNTRLNLESDLGLEETELLPYLRLNYQLNTNHNFFLDWKQLHRQAQVESVKYPFSFEYDGTIYTIHTGVKTDTTFNIDLTRLAYSYNFWNTDNFSMGGIIGLHAMDILISFKGDITACSSEVLNQDNCNEFTPVDTAEKSQLYPLPNFGLFARYQITDNVSIKSHVQYFSASIDKYSGGLIDLSASVDTALSENWFLAFAFNYYEVDLNEEKTKKEINVANYNYFYKFIGPSASIKYQF